MCHVTKVCFHDSCMATSFTHFIIHINNFFSSHICHLVVVKSCRCFLQIFNAYFNYHDSFHPCFIYHKSFQAFEVTWKHFILFMHAYHLCFKRKTFVCERNEPMKEWFSHDFHDQLVGWEVCGGCHIFYASLSFD
jgi:hypothetical protein